MMVSKGSIRKISERSKKIDTVLEYLIDMMLQKDSGKRSNVEELIAHPLFMKDLTEENL